MGGQTNVIFFVAYIVVFLGGARHQDGENSLSRWSFFLGDSSSHYNAG